MIQCFNSESKMPVELHSVIRKVFRFLQWKLNLYPGCFNEEDTEIVSENQRNRFFDLSSAACRYSKDVMKKYTEQLWSDRIRNEYQAEGHINFPKPQCSPLPISKHVTRKHVMTLYYRNNLMNSFLHEFNPQMFPSPLCHCEQDVQTPYHVGVTCAMIPEDIRSDLIQRIESAVDPTDAVIKNNFTLLNASRDPLVLQGLINAMNIQMQYLRTDIEL